MLTNPEIATDLVQDALFKTWLGLCRNQLNHPRAFESWLYRIATNTANDWLRRQRICIASGKPSSVAALLPFSSLLLFSLPRDHKLAGGLLPNQQASTSFLAKDEGCESKKGRPTPRALLVRVPRYRHENPVFAIRAKFPGIRINLCELSHSTAKYSL
jgi:hypothetical protein